ncbi:N-acetylglucosamine-6-phosphate deacetylase, partial [Paenibacillus riograndensis]
MAKITTGRLLFGNVLTPAGIIREGVIAVSEEAIHYAGEAAWLPEAYTQWPAGNEKTGGGLLIPGFVDVHVHGGDGFDFMYADADALTAITRYHASQGTTTMLATTMTAGKKDIDRVLSEVHAFRSAPMPYAQLAGVHLEGPFISPKWSGAQNPEHIVPANMEWLEQWETLYPGLIRQVTIAPEGEGALRAITWLRKHGVTAALGHTNASFEEVIAAADAGLNQAVHMFNAMTPLHHRKPGAAGAILFDERIRAEIIADGSHVHPAAISVRARLKKEGNVLLITDARSANGRSDGEDTIGDLRGLVGDGGDRLKTNEDGRR